MNIYESMRFLDLFKSPLTLLFNRQRFISTKFGFCCSIAIFSLLIALACNSDLFEKSLPMIVSSTTPASNRPLLKLNKKIIAIGLIDEDNLEGFIDPLIYSITISNVISVNNYSSVVNGIREKKKIHKCSEEDFDKNSEIYKNLRLSNYFCVDEDENYFDLEGYFDEASMKYGLIELNLCDNITNNGNCKGFNEMISKLNGKRFDIYYEDLMIESSNYLSPLNNIISVTSRYIDLHYKKSVDLFFQSVQFQSDDGLFFTNFEEFQDLRLNYQYYDFFTLPQGNYSLSMISFRLFSDKLYQNFKRRYTTVSDLLARMGGLIQILMLFAYIFVYCEHSLLLKNTILNSLYVFHKQESKYPIFTKKFNFMDFWNSLKININNNYRPPIKPHMALKFDPGPKKNFLNSDINEFNKKEGNLMPHNDHKILKKTFSNLKLNENLLNNAFELRRRKILEFQEFKNKNQKMNFGVLKFLKLNIKKILPIFNLSYEEQLFHKSEEVYEKELDFIEILKKLQEVEKLKQILLNPKQQILFNFLAKPLLHLNQFKSRKSMGFNSINLDGQKEQKNLEELRKTMDFYEDSKNQESLTEIDKRLFKILNTDVKTFSKKSVLNFG